ncbi:HAD family hydrolase [Rhodoblastus acidophilus]|uniref:HAD family hydrolase n=1 Tax=Candidatus Rhodoblastus alkanivorans TaxID=2954117 RepID=UPI001FA98854|nr:HAD family hydrolase [Candidatus Rhodoblastus alkanivorans]MCI4680385.1 HAD family hydrolase [Candidatus Rhodoblastus alkanivorans]
MSNRYRLLIADFDGTLVETLDDVAWCMKRTFEANGFSAPDRDAVRATIGLSLEDSLRRLCAGPLSSQELSLSVQAYRTFYKTEQGRRSRLFPGVRETLKEINQRGVDVVIVSNKGVDAIRAALSKFDLEELIAKPFGVDVTRHRKPHPALYHEEIKPLFPDVQDHEVLVVGDTGVDLEFAWNAGVAACWASYGYGGLEERWPLERQFILREFADLLEIMA